MGDVGGEQRFPEIGVQLHIGSVDRETVICQPDFAPVRLAELPEAARDARLVRVRDGKWGLLEVAPQPGIDLRRPVVQH